MAKTVEDKLLGLGKHLEGVAEELKVPLLKQLKEFIKHVAAEGAKGFDKVTDVITATLTEAIPQAKETIEEIEKGVDKVVMGSIEAAGDIAANIIDDIEKTTETAADNNAGA